MRTILAILAVSCLAGCRCDVPSKGRAEGGKFRRCAKISSAGEGSVKAGKVTCSWKGHSGSCTPAAGDTLDLCVVAGASSDPATRQNLGAYIETCIKGEVDAVVALGDTGGSREEIGKTAEALATAGVPVLLIPGSREPYSEYLDALESLAASGKPVVDLSKVRILAWGETVLVSLPGIRNPYYLEHPGEGCGWDERDLDDLADLIAEGRKQGRVVLLSTYPPRGAGSPSIDTSRGGTSAGDPDLSVLLAGAEVHVGVFGSIYEAGGVAVDPETGEQREQAAWHQGLYLNPGSIEAVPWEAGGGFSVGQAAVLQIGEGSTRYYMWRVR